uniref:Ribosomal protein L13 n=1 Tax=Nitophyllum punctatum TaxID=158729 RepID=A0A4D6WWV6_9FLOR|nr:ribosomal protein L13 [Nitophyllum punctatum]
MLINKNITHITKSTNQPQWYVVDAKNHNLGRLSSKIAYILKGKNDSHYIPYVRNKVYIIILNSKLIKITGNKKNQKMYRRHSGKPGGLKTETFEQLQQRLPNKIIEKSIKGMLPKNTTGRRLFTQIKVYPDHQHPHTAQQPLPLTIT